MAMGGDCRRRQIEGPNPSGQDQGQGVVLLGGVARMGTIGAGPRRRGFQAQVQGEVVYRAFELLVGDGPLAKERGKTSPVGAFQRVHQIENAAVLSHKRVIAHLIFIPRMGRHKGVQGGAQGVNGFVQHHHPRRGIDQPAVGILA